MTCQEKKKKKEKGREWQGSCLGSRPWVGYGTHCVVQCEYVLGWRIAQSIRQNKMFLPSCLASYILDLSQYCASCGGRMWCRVCLSFLSEIPFKSRVVNMINHMREKRVGPGKTCEMSRVYSKREIRPLLILTVAYAIVSFCTAHESSSY